MAFFVCILMHLCMKNSNAAPARVTLYFNDLSSLVGWEKEESPSVSNTDCPWIHPPCFALRDSDGEESAWRSTISTVGYYDMQIQFRVRSLDITSSTGECVVRYRVGDTGVWTSLWSLTGVFNSRFVTSNLNNDADNTEDKIWVRLVAATRLSYCYFDSLSISGRPITPAPTQTPTESTITPTQNTPSPTSSTRPPTTVTIPPSSNTALPTGSTLVPTSATLSPTPNTISPTSGTIEPTSITGFPTSNTISPTINPTIYPTKMPSNLPSTSPLILPSISPTISPSNSPTLPSDDDSGASPIQIPLTTVYIFMGGLACVCCTILIYVVAYYRHKSKPKPSTNDAIQLSFNDGIDSKTKLAHNNSLPNPVIFHVQATRPTSGQSNTVTAFTESTPNPVLTGQTPLKVITHETNPDNALPEQPSPNEIITKGMSDIESSISEGMTNEGTKANN